MSLSAPREGRCESHEREEGAYDKADAHGQQECRDCFGIYGLSGHENGKDDGDAGHAHNHAEVTHDRDQTGGDAELFLFHAAHDNYGIGNNKGPVSDADEQKLKGDDVKGKTSARRQGHAQKAYAGNADADVREFLLADFVAVNDFSDQRRNNDLGEGLDKHDDPGHLRA